MALLIIFCGTDTGAKAFNQVLVEDPDVETLSASVAAIAVFY